MKFNKTHLLANIKFSTYLSLPKQDLDYDIIVFDECHSLLPRHTVWLSKYKGSILGLTGTPPKRSNSVKAKIINSFCPIVYSYITTEAVNDEILNDYRIIVHLLDISDEMTMPVKAKSGGVFYTSERKSYDYWGKRIFEAYSQKDKQIASVMRMKAMQDFPSKTAYAKQLLKSIEDKVIVFANTQEQAEKISRHSYHSKNPDSEANLALFKQGDIQVLSCVSQLSEGVTVPDLKAAIVMHSYGNERKFMQRFGRCLGLKPGELANIHVLCYKDTVDLKWVMNALEDLDQSKIRYVEFKQEELLQPDYHESY